jgi:hypothetical protein
MLEIAYHDAWLEVNNHGFASFAVINYWLFENAYFSEGDDLFYFYC